MFKKRIKNWFTHFQQYFFTFKDGFFELSFLYNSPETLIASLKKMPFNYHFSKQNLIKTNNPFVKGTMQYCHLEEGLWITVSEMHYKQNVAFKALYDTYIESDYYCLSFNISENKIAESSYTSQNLTVTNTTWVLLKPMAVNNSACFKHTHIYYYTIYIHKNWLKNNIAVNSSLNIAAIALFLNSDVNCKIWAENATYPHKIIESIQSLFDVLKAKNELNTLQLKLETIQIVLHFFKTIFTNDKVINNFTVSNKDKVKILNVEKYLLDHLTKKFEGIDEIAHLFSISPTKLKTDFKNIYGVPLYTYFQSKQMELANEFFKNENYRVNEVAAMFKYENTSKFSIAFKKNIGHLPSEVSRKA